METNIEEKMFKRALSLSYVIIAVWDWEAFRK